MDRKDNNIGYVMKNYVAACGYCNTSFSGKGFRNLTYSFRAGHTANAVANELLLIANGNW